MRAANFILASVALLAACQKRPQDFSVNLRSSDGVRVATLSGYQPRGIAKGYILLTFGAGDKKSDKQAITFLQIENGRIGWISKETIAIVADELKYNAMASDFFPDGTVRSRIRVLTCTREYMDCSSIDKQLSDDAKVQIIEHFPEG